MKAKDKKVKHIKFNLKNLIISSMSILIILQLIILYNHYLVSNDVYAKETNAKVEELKISNAEEVDINAIISDNTKSTQNEEILVEEIDLEYITKYKTNTELPKGVIQVIQEGREGKQQVTKKIVYENGEILSENQLSSKITKASVDKIVEVGAGSGTNTHKIKVGDIVYITSDRLGVMIEPNESSEKKATLAKGNELKVLEIQDDWCKVSGQGAIRICKKRVYYKY